MSSERLGRFRRKVERTIAWVVSFRRRTVRSERQAASVRAFLHRACALGCRRFLHWAKSACDRVLAGGVPDPRLTEVPVAFIIRESDAKLSEQDIIGLCRGQLASFKIPRRVFFVDEFPMTGSGKIQKYLLREEAARRSVSASSGPAARASVASSVSRP
jgi:acyl-CoA synthetase (AMP-forming)/AMP-acid ligase II